MELEVTWRRAFKVWWSFLWRNLIAIVAGLILAVIVGVILGIFMAMLGFSLETTQLVGFILGAVIGLTISVVPIKLILGKDFGEFRLVLLENPLMVDNVFAP